MAGIPWKALSEAYGFLGNSLLAPMTMTASVGLDGRFWEAFPTFGDQGLTDAVAACVCWTQSVRSRAEESGEDSVERCRGIYPPVYWSSVSFGTAMGNDVSSFERYGWLRSSYFRNASIVARGRP